MLLPGIEAGSCDGALSFSRITPACCGWLSARAEASPIREMGYG